MVLAELKAWPSDACLRTVIRQVIIQHTPLTLTDRNLELPD